MTTHRDDIRGAFVGRSNKEWEVRAQRTNGTYYVEATFFPGERTNALEYANGFDAGLRAARRGSLKD